METGGGQQHLGGLAPGDRNPCFPADAGVAGLPNASRSSGCLLYDSVSVLDRVQHADNSRAPLRRLALFLDAG